MPVPLEPTHESGANITGAFEGWYKNPDGSFNLLLRLYNPEAEIAKTPALASLPGIKRVGDC